YLMRFDPKEERFYVYTNKDGTNPLANAYPRFIYESREGILWIGDRKGLIRVDRASGTSEWMRSQNTWLEGSEVMAITELADGRLALGSSNGLLLFAPSTQSLKQYTQKQGLCNNNVCGLLTDEQGNLWLSTFNGLAYFDLENEIFYNFDDKDGFSHHEFNRFSLFRAKDGRIYAGGMNGVNAFYPKQLLDIPPPPPIRLTAFQKYNSSQDSLYLQQTHLQQLDRVVIHPDDTYFQFNFSLPDFTDTKKNQYQSWLKGYEKSWTYLGTNPLVRYSNLPAGQYELLIRGANSKGNWNEEPLKIHIEVQQVFYKTMGFYVCCMLLLSLLGYWLYRNRLNQLLHVERLRTKIASDLHDEIGSIMTRISIGTELLKEGVVSEEDQQKELEHISQQSRQVTSIMSDVIWSIDARKDRLQDLIDRMREHLEELLGAAGITYQLDILALPLQKKLEVDVRQNLYFIFKESINNIVKHSNAQNVQVLIDNSQSELHLSIKDDGTISKQHPKKGQGLKNMALRAQRIGAQLNIRNEEGFEVELKIGGI
ncbi:MAG: triple tyrosine motif-containing protein, partial [Bacteroidota bacterium]